MESWLWLTIQHLSTAHSLPFYSEIQERVKKAEVRKMHGLRQRSFHKWRGAREWVEKGDSKAITLQFPPADWSIASLWATVILERGALFLLLSTMFYDVGYPFGQLGSVVPTVSLSNLSPTPSLLTAGEMRNSLSTAQSLFSSNLNIPVLSTVFWAEI